MSPTRDRDETEPTDLDDVEELDQEPSQSEDGGAEGNAPPTPPTASNGGSAGSSPQRLDPDAPPDEAVLTVEELEAAARDGIDEAVDDTEVAAALTEALEAQCESPTVDGAALEIAVIAALQAELEEPERKEEVIASVKDHLQAAKSAKGPVDGAAAEEAPAPASPAGEPLTADALEDAVLMGLQDQNLDPDTEMEILDVLGACIADPDLDGAELEDAVLDGIGDRIEDPDDRERAIDAITREIEAARPSGASEGLVASSASPGLAPDQLEDAVLMALQEARLEDADLESELLEAMNHVLEDPDLEGQAREDALLDALQDAIGDPDTKQRVLSAVEAEIDATEPRPSPADDEQAASSDGAGDGAEPLDAEEIDTVEDAEIEEVEAEAIETDETIEEAEIEIVEEAAGGPQEGMPEIKAVQEPSPREGVRPPSDAPQTADRATKELIEEIKAEHERRIDAALAEAKELEKKAKELEKKAKADRKLQQEYKQHAEYVAEMAPDLGFDPDRPVTPIPEIEDPNLQEVEFSTIQENYSYIRILYNELTSRYLYQVIEPTLTDTEEDILEFLRDTLVRTMDGRRDDDEQDWEAYLEQEVERAILDHSVLVDQVGKERLQYYIKRDFLGYGPIDVIMQDPMIEDISCDGPGIPIYIFHRQYESTRTNVVFEDESELDSFVISLAQRSGKHISIAEPMLDATLPDTSRLQATLAREVTTRGSSFTIRKFRADPLTPPDLIRLGTMSSRMAAFLWIAMEDGAPMVMAGGTASGKTTTLNAMCQFIPPTKKVVSIEDTREVNLIHENWIAGLTRAGFAGKEGEGSIDMYRLLEAALRQRPEYLLVGEVRGPEAQTLFQAMATGHATYSTLHADSVRSAVYRLENPPINVPRMMLQTLDGIAVQTQVRVNNRTVRRIRSFTEVVGIDSRTGDLLTNQVYEWDPTTDTFEYLGKSHILERRMDREDITRAEMEEEWANRALVMDWMVEKGIRHIEDVNNVLAAYYARPQDVLQRVRNAMEPEEIQELLPESEAQEGNA